MYEVEVYYDVVGRSETRRYPCRDLSEVLSTVDKVLDPDFRPGTLSTWKLIGYSVNRPVTHRVPLSAHEKSLLGIPTYYIPTWGD